MFLSVHEEVENQFSWHLEQAERHIRAADRLLYGPAQFDRDEKFKKKLKYAHRALQALMRYEIQTVRKR